MNNKPITTLEILQIAERCHLLRQTATEAAVLRFAAALIARADIPLESISQQFVSTWYKTFLSQQAEGERALELILNQPADEKTFTAEDSYQFSKSLLPNTESEK